MDPDWRPGNEVERDMLTALEASDGRRYADLLRSSPLYVPTFGDGDQEDWPEGLPQLDDEHVLVFTSPVTLFRALAGPARGYEELHYTSLRDRWPDPETQLVVNPGSPIGVFLSVQQVEDLAEGIEKLMPVEEIQNVVSDTMIEQLRQLCLAELGSDEETAARALTDMIPNELERKLETAVEDLDFDAFLLALLASDVVTLTTEAVADPRRIARRQFPWRVIGTDEAPIIAVFSSHQVLDKVVPGGPHRAEISFLDLLATWPGDDYVMCFNPGTTTELTLPGGGVPELAAAMADAADD
ncbi:SseB family protein [Saccharomonospora sp. NPDC006951]